MVILLLDDRTNQPFFLYEDFALKRHNMNSCDKLYTTFLDRAVQWGHKTAQGTYPGLFLQVQ